MATLEDDVFDLIARLDPTLDDEPPPAGSPRHRAIFDTATRRRSRQWPKVAGVAAGVAVLWPSGDSTTAHAAVLSAAEAMRDVTSFEGKRTHVAPGDSIELMTLRVNGDDFEFESETRFADGHVDVFDVTVVDQIAYVSDGTTTTTSPIGPDDGINVDYGDASAAFIAAALNGADVTEVGTETIDGVSATRYDLALTERSVNALSQLPEEQLRLFDLVEPENVDQVAVWIAEDHVRWIEIAHSDGATTSTSFSNLDGDVTVTRP